VEASTNRTILLAAVGPLSVIKAVVPAATEIMVVATNIVNATWPSTSGRMVTVVGRMENKRKLRIVDSE
jgi:hypothetical protein